MRQLSHLGALELLEQHGCQGEWHYGRIEEIATERYPLVLQCGQGAYCILLAPPRGGLVCAAVPGECGAPRECRADAIQSLYGVLYLSCHPRGDGGQDPSAAAPHWYFGALGLLD